MCKLDSFKNPFATIASLSKFYFKFRRFILLLQRKKVITINYDSSQAVENHKDEWSSSWYLQQGIYTSIPTWTHSQKLLAAAAAAETLSLTH